MFKIKRGLDRTVILIGDLFVLKFPNHSRNLSWFLRGTIANLSEFYCYQTTKASFLVPCFSIGLVTIQKFEKGEIPTHEELYKLMRKNLSKEALHDFDFVKPHAFAPDNWRKNEKGYRMIDYGDSICSGGVALSDFIVPYHEELIRTLAIRLDEKQPI